LELFGIIQTINNGGSMKFKVLSGKIFWYFAAFFVIMTLIHDYLKPVWWLELIIALVLASLSAYILREPLTKLSKKK